MKNPIHLKLVYITFLFEFFFYKSNKKSIRLKKTKGVLLISCSLGILKKFKTKNIEIKRSRKWSFLFKFC